MPPLVDTHCHLDLPHFDADRDSVLQRAWDAGLCGVVIPAVGPSAWEPLQALARTDARLQVGLGIHPQLLPELPEHEDDAQLERLDALLAQGEAAAVGECGLDGPTARRGASLERQLRVLRGQIRLARKHALPVLIHCYRSHPDLVALLQEEPFPEAGVLLHSYSGGAELVRTYSRLGCHFSLAGPVTFLEARKPLETLRAVPPERLLFETDAPDQAPHPFRGQRCEPSHLPRIVEAAARTRGCTAEELAFETTANARRFFQRPFASDGLTAR